MKMIVGWKYKCSNYGNSSKDNGKMLGKSYKGWECEIGDSVLLC